MRIRVPDVVVLSRSAPPEQIIVTPPVAVFEILSPENRMAAMMEKLADYERMGIAGIWIIDPRKSVEKTIGYGYQSGRLEVTDIFGLPSIGITFTLEEIAAFLDSSKSTASLSEVRHPAGVSPEKRLLRQTSHVIPTVLLL